MKQSIPLDERILYGVKYLSSGKSKEYDKWIIMGDESVRCNYSKSTNLSRLATIYHSGHKFLLTSNLDFEAVEIVTPKMPYYQGMITLTNVWNNVIMAPEFIYEVNPSQGLHVNISHPHLNFETFINTWMIIEPYILRNLPEQRFKRLKGYALPLTYPIEDDFEINRVGATPYQRALQNKNMAVAIRGYDTPDARLEVRIYQGTMDLQEIVDWTGFCVFITATSMINPTITIEEFRNILPDSLQRFVF